MNKTYCVIQWIEIYPLDSVIYPSTTGVRKIYFTVNVYSSNLIFEQESGLQMIEGDCMISYLPLAHVYERLAQVRLRKLGLSKVPFYITF